ncbi:MAG: hypothetical protein ACR2NG_03260 [Acidimicrobiia bacterium]
MKLDGQLWFNFSDVAVWHFYRFVRALATQGSTVSLDWQPLPSEDQHEAMSLFVSLSSHEDRGRFLHALLGLVHLEGQDPGDADVVARAAAAAEVEQGPRGSLDDLAHQAAQLGVQRVPSLYRHGPVVTIRLNSASLEGDLERRASTILAMTGDDGIWELSKP